MTRSHAAAIVAHAASEKAALARYIARIGKGTRVALASFDMWGTALGPAETGGRTPWVSVRWDGKGDGPFIHPVNAERLTILEPYPA
jgi:hypothetical protein